MGVKHPALLALDGAVNGVYAAQHAAACRGVAAEGVRAGRLGGRAVGAAGAVADAKDVAEREEDEGAETLHAGQRVPGQDGAPLIVLRQLGSEGFGAQPEVLHIQRGLASGLQARGPIVGERRVGRANAGQAEHERRVPLGGREGHEDGQAVADAVGVRLMAHSRAHLVGSRYVAGPGLAVAQDLLGCFRQAVHVVQLCKHAVDRLHLAAEVSVFASAELIVNLPDPLQ